MSKTATYSSVAATATALGGAPQAALVFAGVGLAAKAVEIAVYSDDPYVDAIRESIKMVIPVKEPYNLFSDEAVDFAVDKAKDMVAGGFCPTGNYPAP